MVNETRLWTTGEEMHPDDKQMFADSILQTIEYFLNKWGTAEQYALAIGLKSREILAIKRNILAEGKPVEILVPDLVNHQPGSKGPGLMDRRT